MLCQPDSATLKIYPNQGNYGSITGQLQGVGPMTFTPSFQIFKSLQTKAIRSDSTVNDIPHDFSIHKVLPVQSYHPTNTRVTPPAQAMGIGLEPQLM